MKKEPIYAGKKISLFREIQALPDGRETTIEVLRHPGAVVILPMSEEGKLFLLRQYRPALARFILEFPAGTLEPGEDPAICAERELQEEIGMSAARWENLGMLFPAPGFCDELQYLYFASKLSAKRRPMDEDEVIEVLEFSASEVEELIRRGELVDGKSLAIFLKAQLHGFL